MSILSSAPILGVSFCQTGVVQPSNHSLAVNNNMTSTSAKHTNEAPWLLVTLWTRDEREQSECSGCGEDRTEQQELTGKSTGLNITLDGIHPEKI